MTRILGLFGFVVIAALSTFLFEWQHVWGFNDDRIELLRVVFYVCLGAALFAMLVAKLAWLPAALLTLGFVLTDILSRAPPDMRDWGLASLLVIGALICGAIARPPVLRTGS